ncbi:MAG: BspA family leucine-rich repeat surface protein [Erysipelotrichaceae bacterium]|nr:BspA family leucine-rich repeat surface protein [Erysipelotrichaceae bacterium]
MGKKIIQIVLVFAVVFTAFFNNAYAKESEQVVNKTSADEQAQVLQPDKQHAKTPYGTDEKGERDRSNVRDKKTAEKTNGEKRKQMDEHLQEIEKRRLSSSMESNQRDGDSNVFAIIASNGDHFQMNGPESSPAGATVEYDIAFDEGYAASIICVTCDNTIVDFTLSDNSDGSRHLSFIMPEGKTYVDTWAFVDPSTSNDTYNVTINCDEHSRVLFCPTSVVTGEIFYVILLFDEGYGFSTAESQIGKEDGISRFSNGAEISCGWGNTDDIVMNIVSGKATTINWELSDHITGVISTAPVIGEEGSFALRCIDGYDLDAYSCWYVENGVQVPVDIEKRDNCYLEGTTITYYFRFPVIADEYTIQASEKAIDTTETHSISFNYDHDKITASCDHQTATFGEMITISVTLNDPSDWPEFDITFGDMWLGYNYTREQNSETDWLCWFYMPPGDVDVEVSVYTYTPTLWVDYEFRHSNAVYDWEYLDEEAYTLIKPESVEYESETSFDINFDDAYTLGGLFISCNSTLIEYTVSRNDEGGFHIAYTTPGINTGDYISICVYAMSNPLNSEDTHTFSVPTDEHCQALYYPGSVVDNETFVTVVLFDEGYGFLRDSLEINTSDYEIWDYNNGIVLFCIADGTDAVANITSGETARIIWDLTNHIYGSIDTPVIGNEVTFRLECNKGYDLDTYACWYEENGVQIPINVEIIEMYAYSDGVGYSFTIPIVSDEITIQATEKTFDVTEEHNIILNYDPEKMTVSCDHQTATFGEEIVIRIILNDPSDNLDVTTTCNGIEVNGFWDWTSDTEIEYRLNMPPGDLNVEMSVHHYVPTVWIDYDFRRFIGVNDWERLDEELYAFNGSKHAEPGSEAAFDVSFNDAYTLAGLYIESNNRLVEYTVTENADGGFHVVFTTPDDYVSVRVFAMSKPLDSEETHVCSVSADDHGRVLYYPSNVAYGETFAAVAIFDEGYGFSEINCAHDGNDYWPQYDYRSYFTNGVVLFATVENYDLSFTISSIEEARINWILDEHISAEIEGSPTPGNSANIRVWCTGGYEIDTISCWYEQDGEIIEVPLSLDWLDFNSGLTKVYNYYLAVPSSELTIRITEKPIDLTQKYSITDNVDPNIATIIYSNTDPAIGEDIVITIKPKNGYTVSLIGVSSYDGLEEYWIGGGGDDSPGGIVAFPLTMPDSDVYLNIQLIKYTVQTDAALKTGQDLNYAFLELAGENQIKGFAKAASMPENQENTMDISTDLYLNYYDQYLESLPVYAWFDESDNTIYWFSTAEHVYLNSSSSNMFSYLSSIEHIDLTGLDSSNVNAMYMMFEGCSSLTDLNISSLDTSEVSDMTYMFCNCSSLTSLDLSNFSTDNASSMSGMFRSCSSLTSLDLSSFDTSRVKDMEFMFSDCSNLTSLNLSSFNTSRTRDMQHMFSDCSSLISLDLSSFDTSAVNEMSYMFYGDYNLQTIYASELWNTDNVGYSESIFEGCYSIVGGNGTTYDSSIYDEDCNDLIYARIDAAGTPGYLTQLNFYTITFVDEDGTVLDQQTLAYGEIPVYAGETPTKASTVQYTYTFNGWDPEIVAVTADATYMATYREEIRKYTITWMDDDGDIIDTTSVAYGVMPSHDDPYKEATAQYTYTFAGWNPEIVMVTGDAIYTATYTTTVNKYTIRFVNEDGTELQNTQVAYGEIPVYNGEIPTKEATEQYTYTFAGWTPDITAVTGNATYMATYTQAVRKYLITFVNYDGRELQSSEVAYGEMPVYSGTTPVKPSDDQYAYIFEGWDPEIVAVTGKATYTATYSPTTNKYLITFRNYDGRVLQSSEVAYGTMPVYSGETPTKEATEQYTYTFAGWTPELTVVTGEATYTATYTPTLRSYTITWKNDDGSLIDTTTVAYGETPTHADPSKAATPQYTYTFSGWTPEIVPVTGEATYTATYTPTLRSYTITWKNDDGSLIDTTTVAYGETPTHADPSKAATPQYTYTFSGWTPEIVPVTGEATYTATYNPTLRSYTITWKNDDGSIIDTTTVAYGTVPSHADPVKPADDQYTYTFTGWTPQVVAVTGEATYTATYSSTVNTYLIRFYNYDDTMLQSSQVAYGELPKYTGPTPTRPDDDQYTYTFRGWNPEIVPVTGEAVYMAEYDRAEISTFVIISLVNGGTDEGVIVSYESVENAQTYEIQVSVNDGEWTHLTNTTATSYMDTAAKVMGSIYSYRVRALADGQWSDFTPAIGILRNPFIDVAEDTASFEHIAWAYNNGIVNGMSGYNNIFSPQGNCERMNFCIMLWKMMGKPAPGKKTPFKDLKGLSTNNVKAITWCYNKKIVAGYTKTTFKPHNNITRAQLAIMIWKFAGKPSVDGMSCPYTDIEVTKTFTANNRKAVIWCYNNGMINSIEGDKFLPDLEGTRALLTEMLYGYAHR